MNTTTDIGELIDHAHTIELEIARYRGRDAAAMRAMSVELSETWDRVDALRELREIVAGNEAFGDTHRCRGCSRHVGDEHGPRCVTVNPFADWRTAGRTPR